MRPLARIVLALSMGLASEMLIAQDPAPQGSEAAAPVPTPAVEDNAAPEATITAPADSMPSEVSEAATAESDVASQAGDAPAEAIQPTPVPSVSQNTDRVEPPVPPPPAPDADVAIGSVEDTELGPSGRKSDWFFLAALAVAVAVIATKLLHTRSERVSIHEDRRLGGLS
ncbi:MAG TPA: hypothetical protein VKG23_08465 [Thermoanaerobaculia bacterium]|nr:hypothetical protein [Thermoanaerobaculia bacterium]